MTTSAYHTPKIGPDGLCTVDGCSRLRSGHLNPRDARPDQYRITSPDGTVRYGSAREYGR